jgi:hypothetical protein
MKIEADLELRDWSESMIHSWSLDPRTAIEGAAIYVYTRIVYIYVFISMYLYVHMYLRTHKLTFL